MAVRNALLGGTDFTKEGVQSADLNDTNDAIIKAFMGFKAVYDDGIGSGLMKFSDSIWQASGGRTTDGGDTWTGLTGWFGIADTFGTAGAGISPNGTNSQYTTDSGLNWNSSTTTPPNATSLNGVALGSATVGIATGVGSSGNEVWYTSDGGNNWAQSGGTITNDTFAPVMASATIGYVFDSSNNIFKTTDGGANFTDTTHNITSTAQRRAIAISTTEILYCQTERFGVGLYDNTAGTVTTLFEWTQLADGATSNWVNIGDWYYIALGNAGLISGQNNMVTSIHLFMYNHTTGETRLRLNVAAYQTNDDLEGQWFQSTFPSPVMIGVGNNIYINTYTNVVLEIPVRDT